MKKGRKISNGFRRLNQNTENTFYCHMCNIQHRRNSDLGKSHLMYEKKSPQQLLKNNFTDYDENEY